jgi:hypothetical protein
MDIKGDFMKFLLEFYSNGKLVKGSYCSYFKGFQTFDLYLLQVVCILST